MRKRISIAAALAVAVTLLAAGAASPAESRSSSLRILTPDNGSRVTSAKLVARVRARGPRFKAVLDGRDVTNRFRRRAHGIREATFRRGRDFRVGMNSLRIQLGAPFSRSHRTVSAVFRAAPRADRRVRVRRLARPRGARAPLHLRMRTTRRVERVRIWANGKRVGSHPSLHRDGRGATAKLGASDHLRFGRNRVLADVEYSDGRVSRTARRFRVSRAGPLPGAGRDRSLAVGRRVRLSGRSSRPARHRHRLSYRWKVVSGPRRSSAAIARARRPKATIAAARSPRPRFRARVPGSYRLRLTVTERVGGRTTRASDEVEASVAPKTGPLGMPIQTITASGAIQVGPTPYKWTGNWVHMLVLDGKLLTKVDEYGFDIGDTSELLDALDPTKHPNLANDLVILTGQGHDWVGNPQFGQAQASALEQAFKALGGTTDSRGTTYDKGATLSDGSWSLIGHLGLTPGEAWQNYGGGQAGVWGFVGGDHGQPGTLNGYLQKLGTLAYDYVSPHHASVDTQAPGSTPTQNVMQVQPEFQRVLSYTSDQLPGGRSAGFQLLALDTNGDPFLVKTYVSRNANGTVNESGLQALAEQLAVLNVSHQQGTVALQSFGNASNANLRAIGNDGWWVNDAIPGFGQSGGNSQQFDYFKWCGGSAATQSLGGYGCQPFPNDTTSGARSTPTVTQAIGPMAGTGARTAVANFGRSGAGEGLSMVAPIHGYSDDEATVKVGAEAGTGLTGTLVYTRQAQWRVAAASPVQSSGQTLWQLAYQPPQPWKLSGRPGSSLANASRYLANRLWPGQGYTDVRQAYPDKLSESWTSNQQTLQDAPCPSGQGFNSSDCEALKTQLRTEFSLIRQVAKMFDNYQQIFATASTDAVLNMNDIGQKVVSAALQDNAAYEARPVEVKQKDIAGDALYLAADVIGLPFPEVGGVVGVFAGAYDVYSDLTDSGDYGSGGTAPFDEPRRIMDKADQVGTDLVTRYQGLNDTFTALEKIFVGDWGKLQAANAHAIGDWGLNKGTDAETALEQTMSVGAHSAFYRALLPVAYDEWVVSPSFTRTDTYQNQAFNGSTPVESLAGPTGYRCDPGPAPFSGAQDSSVNWVRYAPSGTRSDTDAPGEWLASTGRALKSKANPLTLTVGDYSENVNTPDNPVFFNYRYPATSNAGAAPDQALTDMLFEDPTAFSSTLEPNGLAIAKDEFFGMDAWTTPRLQCGRPFFSG